jgi:uncharacterized protein
LEADQKFELPELGVGVIYSADLEPLFASPPEALSVIEVEPQTMWIEQPGRPGETLAPPGVNDHLASLPYAKLVHSIGTPVGGSVPATEAQLPLLRESVRALGAPWASEHLAFNLTPDFFTGFFLPPRQTCAGLETYVKTIERLAGALDVPFAFETGVNYLRARNDEMPDGQFVGELAERANCGILLDLHNLYTNERNGRQKVWEFVEQILLERVWEIHLAGGFEWGGYWVDAHSGAIPDRLFDLSREILPHLPNLKAIIFEVFSSFLPRFGLDGVRSELDRLRELWDLRRTNASRPGRTRAIVELNSNGYGKPSSVEQWEIALGSLAIGRSPDTPLSDELAADKGVGLMRELIHEFRASMVVGVYRLSCRLMMLALSPGVFRTILEDFWAHEPPRQYAGAEAEAFIAYLREKNLRLPQLDKTLEFEKAAMDTLLDGNSRVVRFSADPFPMLRALAEGRLPEGVPQEGDYEIEINPEGPITVSGMNAEAVRGAFPFQS